MIAWLCVLFDLTNSLCSPSVNLEGTDRNDCPLKQQVPLRNLTMSIGQQRHLGMTQPETCLWAFEHTRPVEGTMVSPASIGQKPTLGQGHRDTHWPSGACVVGWDGQVTDNFSTVPKVLAQHRPPLLTSSTGTCLASAWSRAPLPLRSLPWRAVSLQGLPDSLYVRLCWFLSLPLVVSFIPSLPFCNSHVTVWSVLYDLWVDINNWHWNKKNNC